MSNRNILFATVLFLVLVLGFILSSPSKSHKINSNQDFTITIPPKESNAPHGGSIHEETNQHVVSLTDEQQLAALADVLSQDHTTIYSNMSNNGRYFKLDFLGVKAYNPNVLPHPNTFMQHPPQYIMIAQATQTNTSAPGFLSEIACSATFVNNGLKCLEPPVVLPIAATVSDKCPKKLEPFNYVVGPHDARVFYGPERPYILYGSPSSHSCMGMWMQELGRVYYWQYLDSLPRTEPFFQPTDLQRPGEYNVLEKNWFPFWDRAGDMYLHYDVAPKRFFAKVNATGGIGPDLAPQAAAHDDACMAQFLPKIANTGYEHLHQSTNSLLITLCDRDDPTCFETEHNTFIMTIFHHKSSYLHDIYEPYVMLFKRTAPFELYAISKKPLWINGREKPSGSAATGFTKSKDQLFYVTSFNWKGFGKKYQGYSNDDLFISFGIEDKRSGAIDVRAGDLVADLGICSP